MLQQFFCCRRPLGADFAGTERPPRNRRPPAPIATFVSIRQSHLNTVAHLGGSANWGEHRRAGHPDLAPPTDRRLDERDRLRAVHRLFAHLDAVRSSAAATIDHAFVHLLERENAFGTAPEYRNATTIADHTNGLNDALARDNAKEFVLPPPTAPRTYRAKVRVAGTRY